MSSSDICQPLDQALVESSHSVKEERFSIEARSSTVGTFIRFPSIANSNYSIRYPDPLIKVNDTVKVK